MANKVALLILDGFAITPETTGNAILNAKTPNLDEILPRFPKCLLKASAEEVGLPWGEFGSSEVGHTSIGLGRIVLQDLPQITRMLADGSIQNKPEYKKILVSIDQGAKVNLLFLMSDGAVHGHIQHLISLVKLIKTDRPSAKIILHMITDGRDTAEKSALMYFDLIQNEIGKLVLYGSMMGRYFAMDRDKNWDRIQLAYNAIIGQGVKASNPKEAIDKCYESGKNDEFLEPVSFGDGFDLSKDIMVFTNYRSDRAIQITRAFIDPSIVELKRSAITRSFFSMTTYDDNLGLNVLFSNIDLNNPETNPLSNPISQLISEAQLKQFHIAETEKFAHITHFFSGGIRQKFNGEDDKLIPSKKIATYDKFPQMRAIEIASEIALAASTGYQFIAANFANGDMVGHSGNFEATIQAVSILDKALAQALGHLLNKGYEVFITADHGNCDEMIDFSSGKPNKEHTLNPVPFIHCSLVRAGKYCSKSQFFNAEPVGILADISPTILASLGIQKSTEMTGMDLTNSMI